MIIFKKTKAAFLDILFPPICLNCQKIIKDEKKDSGICQNCLSNITINTSLFCPICKARFPSDQKTCHKNSKYILAATTNYENEIVRNLIWTFKYRNWQKLQNILSILIIKYLGLLNSDLANYLIIPIPLHKDRQKTRGFNQSELLGKLIAEKLKLNIDTGCLKRIKYTKTQTELEDHKERELNVKNCFSINNPEIVKDRNIILIDDVFTSGATMNEASNILRVAGAKKIIALVFAKA